MSEPTFTPGPWLTEPADWSVAGNTVWKALDPDNLSELAYEQKICDIRGWGHLIATELLSDAEATAVQVANAHLIASAPDLYAALDELLGETTSGYHPSDPSLHGCGCARCGKYQAARAALAKARGET